MAEKADCGSAKAERSGVTASKRDLLQLGMDSLLFLELSSDIQHYTGVRINAERAWQDLSPHGLTQLICSKPEATPAASQPEVLRHDADERYAPFPLTPIQHAYWLGRTHLIGYGGVACHVLFEWDKRHDEFNLAILEKAWNQLIARHDMLRMVVDADGQQRIRRQRRSITSRVTICARFPGRTAHRAGKTAA